LQNPPRFPSPPAKGAPRKSKVSFKLPEIKSKKKRRRKANLYDVIARMTPVPLRLEAPSNIYRSRRPSWIPQDAGACLQVPGHRIFRTTNRPPGGGSVQKTGPLE
jgi:hypothetical protein